MKSEHTAWAEGYGFSDSTIKELTLIAEESDRRAANGARPSLVTGDLAQWAAELDVFDMQDLAEQVRALPEYV
jgi:hypothetical protein